MRRVVITALLALVLSASASAQRQLHWDALEVAAHLNTDGTLRVAETHTMVFTGDWNGGERVFNIRPRQGVSVRGVSREVGGEWRALTEDSSLDDVDEYAMSDGSTLRWRSRRPDDPPFAGSRIRYRIDYELSGIVFKDDESYRIEHDFAFPDREGSIDRFELALTFEPAWQPLQEVQPLYTAGPLAPGRSFVLAVPMRYVGEGSPAAIDLARSREIVFAVGAVIAVAIIGIAALFVREQRRGRFAPLVANVDEAWVREHILKHPAEVVAAAWDENVGTAEVVALLARMEADGQLESIVGKSKSAGDASMTLRLKADRSSLNDYERALINKLFFGSRFETSTAGVRAHYKKTGFSPAEEIRPGLEAAVNTLLDPTPARTRFSPVSIGLFVTGLALIFYRWFQGHPGGFALILPMIAVTGIGWVTGLKFRSYMHWGRREAWLCLIPVLLIALATVWYLWVRAGGGHIVLAPLTASGIVAVALACILSCLNAMKSRRTPSAVAFRKTLTAGREYFIRQLNSATPALRDKWYPWLLGLELSKQVDAWTTRAVSETGQRSQTVSRSSSASSSRGASSASFSGFTGGRSGGAGASASWHAAASSMAATVAPPSSSGSGSGSGGSRSSGGGGGRSGGGGGGGW
jgi:uncharacterized membrane protein YgcG